MEKIDVAELLKKCPKGMELDCMLWDNVTFDRVADNGIWIKHIDSKSREHSLYLYHDGSFPIHNLGSLQTKCVIFPKGKTTWAGFVPPCKFNDGDIVYIKTKYEFITIYKETNCNVLFKYAAFGTSYNCFLYDNNSPLCYKQDIEEMRLATEEEKEKLFQAIKDNGYRWNVETKTLEKLIEPKFKAGDRIAHKNGITKPFTISQIGGGYYYVNDKNAVGIMRIEDQDNYELVPNKFDINTLVPFESRVLVRTKHFHDKWIAGFFSHKDSYEFAPFWTTADKNYQQCIPYEGNEHLLGKTDDCDDYYKTWE